MPVQLRPYLCHPLVFWLMLLLPVYGHEKVCSSFKMIAKQAGAAASFAKTQA